MMAVMMVVMVVMMVGVMVLMTRGNQLALYLLQDIGTTITHKISNLWV